MDSLFGIGTPELILIVLIAGVVLGPERIRPAARWLGKTTAQAKLVARGFMDQLNRELDSVDSTGEVKATLQEVKDLQRQVTELRRELLNSTQQPFREGQQALQEARASVDSALKEEARQKVAPPPPPPEPVTE